MFISGVRRNNLKPYLEDESGRGQQHYVYVRDTRNNQAEHFF